MIPTAIIGSLRGIRFLDSYKSYPTYLTKIYGNKSALDWNLAALRKAGIGRITYVCGYHMEKVLRQHPDLHYVFHANWQQEGSAKALLCAEEFLSEGGLIVDSGIVFDSEAVETLIRAEPDLIVGVETLEDRTFHGDENILSYLL